MPGTKKGDKLRKYIDEMLTLYGPWIDKYRGPVPRKKIAMRIWIESRGNPWSQTKDNYLHERGLTSIPKWAGAELGGDPCGDPEWSICATAWMDNQRRQKMIKGPGYWSSWISRAPSVQQSIFIGACGSTNCQKVALMCKHTACHKQKNPWWHMLSYYRSNNGAIIKIIQGVKVSEWRFGFRLGRVVNAWMHIYGESGEGWSLPDCPTPKIEYDAKKWGQSCIKGKKAKKQAWPVVHSWEPGFEVWRAGLQAQGMLP
jgi:hypothetical protein